MKKTLALIVLVFSASAYADCQYVTVMSQDGSMQTHWVCDDNATPTSAPGTGSNCGYVWVDNNYFWVCK